MKTAAWCGVAVLLVAACGGADDGAQPVEYPPPPAPLDSAAPGTASTLPGTPPPPPPVPPPPPPPAAPRSTFATVNGLKMHYLRLGDRPGEARPVLVLLHPGAGSAASCWPTAIPYFAERYDVIAPDQLAQGGTPDDPKHPMTTHAMAEDTVGLLVQLNVARASFVGWSDGANEALDIGMHHPDKVVKIVASSGNFSPEGADPAAAKLFFHLKPDAPMLAPARESYARESPDGAAHFAAVFERLRKMWQTDPRWTRKDLGTIKAPTLIMAGDHDSILPAHTVAMAAAIPGSDLSIVPHADHDMPITDASRWDAIVQTFLDEPPRKPMQ